MTQANHGGSHLQTGYVCLLRVKIQPAKLVEFKGLIHQLQDDTLREIAGVTFYEFLATDDPLVFVLMQGFADEEVYQRYANVPFHLEMAPAGGACLDGDPSIEFMRPVSKI